MWTPEHSRDAGFGQSAQGLGCRAVRFKAVLG